MKKFITRAALLTAAVLTLTGCNSKEHFAIYPSATIYQDYYEGEIPQYFSYVAIQSYYPMESASATVSSVPVTMSRVNADGVYAFDGTTSPTITPSTLEGTYVFKATGTADEGLESAEMQGVIRLNDNKMAKINTVSFEYEKPRIKAIIEDVDYASELGFYFVFNDNRVLGFDRPITAAKNEWEKDNEGNYIIQMNLNAIFGISDFVENNKVKIYVMAKGSDSVIQRSIFRTLEKGAEEFNEGNYPAE